MMGDEEELAAIGPPNRSIVPLAQPSRALAYRVEHDLEAGRRARDSPENFASRRLLLQRLGKVFLRPSEFAPARFKLLVQIGRRLALASNTRLRLRSGRTEL